MLCEALILYSVELCQLYIKSFTKRFFEVVLLKVYKRRKSKGVSNGRIQSHFTYFFAGL